MNWITLGLGVLFLYLAAKQWQSRPKEGEEPEMPAWMSSVDSFTPWKSFGFGVALSGANPKNLASMGTAAASMAQAGLSGGQSAVAVAVFVLIGSISVAGPVLFVLIAPEKAAGPLATMKAFMTQHSSVIMMVVLLVPGAKLIGDGLAGVTNESRRSPRGGVSGPASTAPDRATCPNATSPPSCSPPVPEPG